MKEIAPMKDIRERYNSLLYEFYKKVRELLESMKKRKEEIKKQRELEIIQLHQLKMQEVESKKAKDFVEKHSEPQMPTMAGGITTAVFNRLMKEYQDKLKIWKDYKDKIEQLCKEFKDLLDKEIQISKGEKKSFNDEMTRISNEIKLIDDVLNYIEDTLKGKRKTMRFKKYQVFNIDTLQQKMNDIIKRVIAEEDELKRGDKLKNLKQGITLKANLTVQKIQLAIDAYEKSIISKSKKTP